ncbi:PHD finger protein 7-like [Bradysia coprophila]|uniref:PHD finger protein 7-like n=1 Tax=Bradysia coprophila TaxID=38358 RepID=UPI00187D6F17|nr:PHD finger protein 7-like [Bradysia coprophila]XP_037029802.1 PHD finger protein 7-like [Bradysia coprophila]
MNACILCKSKEINNLELGEMKVLGDLQVHYFCLLLSSGLLTNGEEDEGILGFLPPDIKKESRRAIRLKCLYCHQTGATIGCCISACNASFHLNCGLKNNCLSQFTPEYKSFCHRHVECSTKVTHSEDHICIICYSEMGTFDKIQSVFTPCCKSEWFHKCCLMRLADSAGYFFKCPKCNDVETFTDECMKRGIFVPQRDAAWETEENAFHELMERPNRCNAEKCVCVDGRESDKPSNELLICETCGSNCIHKKCWQRKEPYYCCYRVDQISSSRREPKKKNIAAQKDEIVKKIQNKRKREHQTDDEKLDEKRRKKRKTEKFAENQPTPEKTKGTRSRECSVNCKTIDETKRSRFPIKKIRNGTFDQILRYKPRVLLYPVSLDQFNNSSKKIAESSNSNRSLVTSNIDNSLSKKDSKSSEFTLISPKRKNGGPSFKNYMITSFFKPYLNKD